MQTEGQRRHQQFLASPYWQEFSRELKAARGHKCARCPKTGGELHVHHKSYRDAQGQSILGFERLYPESVEVLCKDCHDREHPERAAAKKAAMTDEESLQPTLPVWVTPEEEEWERLLDLGLQYDGDEAACGDLEGDEDEDDIDALTAEGLEGRADGNYDDEYDDEDEYDW
jgi:5-methylcytosine-specific restriction endonuclease McrA